MLSPLLILFAKAPIAGRVKTRLCPPLTPAEACALHSALVVDTGRMLAGLSAEAFVELSTDLPIDAWPLLRCARSIQSAGDLGERLSQALVRGLDAGHSAAVVIGSDSPGLPSAHVRALYASAADVTLGPTADGGFFGIGCRAIHPKLFNGIRWSTQHALEDMVASAMRCGLSVDFGPAWFDVDVEEDLVRLMETPLPNSETLEWVRAYRSKPVGVGQ